MKFIVCIAVLISTYGSRLGAQETVGEPTQVVSPFFALGIQSGRLSNFNGLSIVVRSPSFQLGLERILNDGAAWSAGFMGVVDAGQNHIFQQTFFLGYRKIILGAHPQYNVIYQEYYEERTSPTDISFETRLAYDSYSYRGENLVGTSVDGGEFSFWAGASIRSSISEYSSLRASVEKSMLNLTASSEMAKFEGLNLVFRFESRI